MVRLFFAGVEHMEEVAGKVCNIGGSIDNSLSLLELFIMLEKELDVKLNYKKVRRRFSLQIQLERWY